VASGQGTGGNGTPGRTSAGTSDSVIQVSQNVEVAADPPMAHALQVAWQAISREYPHGDEFSNWYRLCAFYHSLCAGQLGSAIGSGITPNYATEEAWNSGIKYVLGKGNNINGYIVPLAGGVAASRILARNLINAGYDPVGLDAAHHIVAGGAPDAADARAVLARYGIDINDPVNGVWLPRNLSVPNPGGAAVHSTLHTDNYYGYINDQLDGVQS
jgi:hypothetical protein